MLKFYFSKGSSALAAHILLIETGANFEAIEVPIAQKAHQSAEHLRRNPKGRIPVLETPDGMLTENPAILEYIAETHPDAGCLPNSAYDRAQARAVSAYLCATVHVAFAHGKRSARWADDPASHTDMRQKTPQNLLDCAAYLERELDLNPWASGDRFTYCDPYLFLLDRWLSAFGASLDTLPKLAAHRDAMQARPATIMALQAHDLA